MLQTLRKNIRRTVATIVAAGLTLGVTTAATGEQPINDTTVRDAVENELLFDRVVPLNDIDVRVNQRIVTLDGEVSNLLAKERAARVASTVKGVRSVVNTLSVRPVQSMTAKTLRNDVEAALLNDPATDSYEIGVEADQNGNVTLTGSVDSWQEKRLAATVAKSVHGVTGIDNRISVAYQSIRPDAEIQPEIEKVLQWDTLVDDGLIDVQVKDGKVTLTGTVGSAAEKSRAYADAWVAGVKSVDMSGLEVKRWARDEDLREDKYASKSDQAIRDAVKDALMYDPRVFSFNVTPEVSNGVVTLRGEVDNLKAKRVAEMDARNTVGVNWVRNRLKVRPAPKWNDGIVAQNVRSALSRDPYIERHEVNVSVHDGIVYLYGEVDSWFEKAQADDAAAKANGVKDVRNHLSVDDPTAIVYDPYIYPWYPYGYHWFEPADVTTEKSDRQIERDIEDELWWSPFVDSDDVTVSVDDGVATLTGDVQSMSEWNAARENAYEGGATRVICDLKITSEDSFADRS